MTRRLWPLLPLVPLYGAALAWHERRYGRASGRQQRLQWPVISIGNLSVGGAGKTPFTILLARALAERGWHVDVLSRGYGRSGRSSERVDPAMPHAAERFGDEPTLIARSAEVPVFVARGRFAAGSLAEATFTNAGRRLHLLDDGMQHRQLHRDVEIVLLHRSDFSGALLPAGRMREPLRALARADFVVLREEDRRMEPMARRWTRQDAQIWYVRRSLLLPRLPGPAVAFSAIAHPQEFVAQLEAAGAGIAGTHAFRDHHRFTRADMLRLLHIARATHASCMVTTEKDGVRLTDEQRALLEDHLPLYEAPLQVALTDPEPSLDALEELLMRRRADAMAQACEN